MSENLQQVIFYTCILIVFYMIWGTPAVIEGLVTLAVIGILGLLIRAATNWWYGPDPFAGRGAERRDKSGGE